MADNTHVCRARSIFVHVHAAAEYVERRHHGNLTYFGCQCFAKLYDETACWVDDLARVMQERGDDVRKINFCFHSGEEYARVDGELRPLPITYASGIPNNYEISPDGVAEVIERYLLA